MTTQATPVSVIDHIAQVKPEQRRDDARTLDRLFRDVSGFEPRMWGPTIIGYGTYHYVYDSGREGDMCATGFAARKANLVLYIMPGYQNYGAMLDRLGKHKLGKSCLYINKLADVDTAVLREIIRTGLDDLGAKWTVQST